MTCPAARLLVVALTALAAGRWHDGTAVRAADAPRAGAAATGDGGPVDLLVFGPHPDDEVIACGGIIRQALTAGKRVKAVVFTNGDGLPDYAATLARKQEATLGPEDFLGLASHRQRQSQKSFALLGGAPGDLMFLGYPDGGLDKVYDAKGERPYEHAHTRKSETYGDEQPDRHSVVHGRPAPYTYDAALGDVVELIRTFEPAEIYVTNEGDSHPDHKAAFRFVRDALRATGHTCDVYTFVNHAGPEWPWPTGYAPQSRFESREVRGQRSPRGVPWPPTHRVPLVPEAVEAKFRAIQASMIPERPNAEGKTIRRDYFESFAKSEEVFWKVDVRRDADADPPEP